MDSGDSLIDPQAEVRKLQDLVKKLEHQNELLRNKKLSSVSDNLPIQDGQPVKQYSKSVTTLNSRINDKENKSSVIDLLDDVDLIDIDKSLTDSEDSWLYSSPRPLTPKQSCVSPYKWVRQDLDHPSPDIDVARRSLRSKLEEAARLSRSTSTPAFSNVSITPARSSPTMSQSADNTPSSSSRLQRPAIRQSLVSNMGTRVDSGTFTRPKKSKECDASVENHQVEVSKENVAQTYPNVADIETLAKLQEESLRQSLAQTSPRRGFRSRPLPHVAPVSSDTDNSGSPAGSNRSSPARIEAEGINHKMNNSNNSLGSDNSSPPDSPFGSNQHLHPQSDTSHLRRSLPNVSRLAQPQFSLHGSEPHLDQAHYEDPVSPESQISRLQPLRRTSSPGISGLKTPQQRNERGLSPQRPGLPQPSVRRSIPRMTNTGRSTPSGLPTPRRSGIPSPRQVTPSNGNRNNNHFDDSWREGCF